MRGKSFFMTDEAVGGVLNYFRREPERVFSQNFGKWFQLSACAKLYLIRRGLYGKIVKKNLQNFVFSLLLKTFGAVHVYIFRIF